MELMAMVDMVLDTVLTHLDMVMVLDMATLPSGMVMDLALDTPGLDVESVLLKLSPKLMLFMELMDMADMAWDTVPTLLDTVLDMADTPHLVVGMAMAVDLDTMVNLLLIKGEDFVTNPPYL